MYKTDGISDENFAKRLFQLRSKKGVSARDMSLSIGQNAGYINNIESGRNLPSMTGFFYICDYLGVTPGEFFDGQKEDPARLRDLTEKLKRLNEVQLKSLEAVADAFLSDGKG